MINYGVAGGGGGGGLQNGKIVDLKLVLPPPLFIGKKPYLPHPPGLYPPPPLHVINGQSLRCPGRRADGKYLQVVFTYRGFVEVRGGL